MEGADLVAAGLAAGCRPQVVFVRATRALELSTRLGLTRERVRQVQNEALSKLKRYLARRGITREALL